MCTVCKLHTRKLLEEVAYENAIQSQKLNLSGTFKHYEPLLKLKCQNYETIIVLHITQTMTVIIGGVSIGLALENAIDLQIDV